MLNTRQDDEPSPSPYRIAQPLMLARAGLDRTAHLREDEQALALLWCDDRTRAVLVCAGQTLAADGSLLMVRPEQAPPGERYLLGTRAGGGGVFAVRPEAGLPSGSSRAGLRELGHLLDDEHAGLLVHAIALSNWHETHPRCPRCGTPTEPISAGHARRCPADGSQHFPRTDPAMIVLVLDGRPPGEDRCLLGRQARWPAGRFSTLAGFVEVGEPVERTVVREVAEEAGVEVGEVWYAGSQPWPFPSSLMLAFYASLADPANDAITVDGTEIAEAAWFTRQELRAALVDARMVLPPSVSVARRLIEGWLGGPVDGLGAWR